MTDKPPAKPSTLANTSVTAQLGSEPVGPEWEVQHLFTRPSVTLIDGSKSGRLVMRRMVNGELQYREPTKEESREYVSKTAW